MANYLSQTPVNKVFFDNTSEWMLLSFGSGLVAVLLASIA